MLMRVAAEDRADVADDAWLILVVDDEQRPFERRLDLDAVELSAILGLPGSNTVPSIQLLAVAGVELQRQQVGRNRAAASCATR